MCISCYNDDLSDPEHPNYVQLTLIRFTNIRNSWHFIIINCIFMQVSANQLRRTTSCSRDMQMSLKFIQVPIIQNLIWLIIEFCTGCCIHVHRKSSSGTVQFEGYILIILQQPLKLTFISSSNSVLFSGFNTLPKKNKSNVQKTILITIILDNFRVRTL